MHELKAFSAGSRTSIYTYKGNACFNIEIVFEIEFNLFIGLCKQGTDAMWYVEVANKVIIKLL